MRAFIVAAVLLAGIVPAIAPAAGSTALQPVRYNMGWLPQGSQAGVFMAWKNGLYAKAGLDVSITRGYGGLRTVNEVDQGMFDIGYGDALAVLLNHRRGGHARLVGVLNQTHPGGLCFIADRHRIRRPQDLVGLTVAGGISSPVQVMLPAWLAGNGVAAGKVRLIQMDPTVVDAALLTGKADAVECWRGSNKSLLAARARSTGLSLDWLEYRQFGADVYGNGFVASQDFIRQRPQVLRSFLAATAVGYQLASRNPSGAAAVIHERSPEADPAVLEEQVRDIVTLLPPGDPVPNIGRIDPARIQRTRDFYVRALGLSEAPAAQDLYTNNGD